MEMGVVWGEGRCCHEFTYTAKFYPIMFLVGFSCDTHVLNRSENVETMALLDAIVEAVGNASDGALRDFAAKVY